MCDFNDGFEEGGLPCKCRRAVMTVYHELKDDRCPEKFAVEAAYRVYRHHHPEDSKSKGQLTVDRWLHAGHFH